MAEAQDSGIPVSQAAVLLGISVQAVRKRLQRGHLRAYKVDGQWRVVLPVQPAVPPASSDTGRDSPQDSGGDSSTVALIDELRAEVAFLRQLTEHQAGVIATLSARVPALPTPASPVTTSPTMDATPAAGTSTTADAPRHRWRFWTRR